MSCLESDLKNKEEDIMDYSEEACGGGESSQISINSLDSNASIDPFEDCSPIMRATPCLGGASGNQSHCIDMESPSHSKTSQNAIPSPSGVSSNKAPSKSPSKAKYLEEAQETWMGSPIQELQKGADGYGYPQLETVKPSSTHTVLFKVVNGKVEPAEPFPDVWDSDHVRMPCSPMNKYPVGDELKSRWEMIKSALQKRISTSAELEEAIMSYNTQYSSRWDFTILHKFFNEMIEPEEADCFFRVLLPQIVNLALQLPNLITRPIPLLRRNHGHSISMTQMQVACLLANGFFCTFPRRNTAKQTSEYGSFPDINFNKLFHICRARSIQRRYEKLKCMFHYFRRVCHEPPKGTITFSRRYIGQDSTPVWSSSSHSLHKLHISSTGTIEDNGKGMLHVDFADKRIGGGVLGGGCVQEEIRFVICPELIVACLFTEVFNPNEALVIAGCERFSKYDGYADGFTWAGDYVDPTPRDSSGRMLCTVIAIDALPMRFPTQQFTVPIMLREINKAFIGFSNPDIPLDKRSAVATGNWGCGVFRGNPHLKSLLQILAAAESGRALTYFTFGNTQLMSDVAQMHEFLTERKVTVGAVWRILSKYYDQCFDSGCFTMDLYEFIYNNMDPSYVPKMTVVKSRNKESFSITKVNKASTSGSTTSMRGGSSRMFGSKRLDSNKEGPQQATWSKGQKVARSTKEVKQRNSPMKVTHRHRDDDANLRKARPANTQKRIFDYFHELNIPK